MSPSASVYAASLAADAQCRHPAPAGAWARGRHDRRSRRCSAGFAYVWSTPDMRAAMLLAFLINFAAYPFVGSLLAYVARDIYGLDQRGMGWLIACFAGGALAGLDRRSSRRRPDPAGAHHDRGARCCGSCLNLVFSWISVAAGGRGDAARHRLRAELLHGADGGDPAAHRRSCLPRPRDGRAHARRLRPAARDAAERSADRTLWLCRRPAPLFSLVGIGFAC